MVRTYQRDGRAPVPKDERTSAIMSRIRSKDTAPERTLRAGLRAVGLRGYRLHWKQAPGRPDIAFPGKRLAVFVHGCYWHGCPLCKPRKPKTNSVWWQRKIAANQARDKRKEAALRRAGWSVITLRECRLKKAPDAQVLRVTNAWAKR